MLPIFNSASFPPASSQTPALQANHHSDIHDILRMSFYSGLRSTVEYDIPRTTRAHAPYRTKYWMRDSVAISRFGRFQHTTAPRSSPGRVGRQSTRLASCLTPGHVSLARPRVGWGRSYLQLKPHSEVSLRKVCYLGKHVLGFSVFVAATGKSQPAAEILAINMHLGKRQATLRHFYLANIQHFIPDST